MSLEIEQVNTDTLKFDTQNARKHSGDNLNAIAKSLKEFGQRKPIVVTHDNTVLAGNGTLEAALLLGWEKIAVARVPEDWSHEKRMAYALADNRTAELAEWDEQVLSEQLMVLESADFDLSDFLFDTIESDEYDFSSDKDAEVVDEGLYTSKITAPIYEIVGEKPETYELFDDSRARELQEKIEDANLPEDVADFLKIASMRHVVFNYSKVAEFYPHASKEIQRLMEESALVIIDAKDAIRLGFAKFNDSLQELLSEEENA